MRLCREQGHIERMRISTRTGLLQGSVEIVLGVFSLLAWFAPTRGYLQRREATNCNAGPVNRRARRQKIYVLSRQR